MWHLEILYLTPAQNGWIEMDMGSFQSRWLQLGQCPVDKRKIGQFVADDPAL